MKNIKHIIALFLTSVVILGGCQKDDNPLANGFTYGETFYAAETFGVYLLPENNTYEIAVSISTGNWNFTTEQHDGYPFSFVLLHMIPYVDNDNLLGVGEYAYSATSLSEGTIYGGTDSFYLNIDSNSQWEVSSNITGGSLTVRKDGEFYVLDYELSLANGETIVGYYRGVLDYIYQD